jgi:hypothetical protein
MTECGGFLEKELVETRGVDLVALEQRPGVVVVVGRVDPADQVLRQAPFRLEAVEGLERRGGEDPAEIPDHRLDP